MSTLETTPVLNTETDTRATALRLIDFLKQKVTELYTARESAEDRVRSLTKELVDLKERLAKQS